MDDNNKIAFLCHPYHRGGVTRWMADAALAYAKNGLEVYFITVEPIKEFLSAGGRETLLQLLNKENTTIHIIKISAGSDFEFGTADYRAYIYRKLVLQLPAGTPVILSDDETIWKAATFFHGIYPLIGVLHADEAYYYNLAKKFSRQVDVLVCVSERVRKTVSQFVPRFDPALIFTIPCGINLPAIDYNTSSGNLLRLVYVGRISDYQKRTGDLVKIGSLLAKNGIKFHLNIIGDGNGKTNLENKIKEAQLEEYISLFGWRSQQEVAKFLSGSDIMVLTSDFEGTPIAMMEALASGCGFTGTRVSGIEDYEHHHLASDCFAVYTVGDIEDAVNKINKVAAISASIRKQAARKLAETEFSMKVCLEKYSNVIAAIKPFANPIRNTSLSFFKLLYSKTIAIIRYYKVRMTS